MPFSSWQRLQWDDCPIYVHPEKPDWFVADDRADLLLQALRKTGDLNEAARFVKNKAPEPETLFTLQRLQSLIAKDEAAPYRGRAKAFALGRLKECWFHLTDNCNLACRHCLFGSSPAEAKKLAPELLEKGLAEAKKLGCALFYFTGGEPFVFPGFSQIITEVLREPANHAVILTNGLLLEKHMAWLQKLPADRLHLQISLDGLKKSHEYLRGVGAFDRLLANLALLKKAGLNTTLSVAVSRVNMRELPEIVSLAAEQGVRNIHLLWHFVRGKGSQEQFAPPADILPHLFAAQQTAEAKDVVIDNVETLRSQVFGVPGTRYDLSNTAWESIAVGPDGNIYPSPALVGLDELCCGALRDGLEKAWQESPVLNEIRRASLADSAAYRQNPLKFIIGGGDIDHSYLAGGAFTGHDPYVELYNGLALWLIARQAARYPGRSTADFLLKMGDVRHDCPDGGQGVSLTHCNCVISLSDDLGHSPVREFYAKAAVAPNRDIANPFAPEQARADFIPQAAKQRSYGCGSPVRAADPRAGEVLVDLGSGSGVECFMAAAEVGVNGKVYGIDMTDEMLELARASQKEVVRNLGYDNVEFRKGFLESIPLADETADVVISNCVINLSPDKRRTFHEIYRILKPGGRLVVSDIVTDAPVPVAIQNNDTFRGECLGGALRQEDLLAMLRAAGFAGSRLLTRLPYRREDGTDFYSLTFSVHKPEPALEAEVVYPGPFGAVYTENGVLLLKGKRTKVLLRDVKGLGDSVLILDSKGAVTNVRMTGDCCGPAPAAPATPLNGLALLPKKKSCCENQSSLAKPDRKIVSLPAMRGPTPGVRHRSGCMVCGGEITYLKHEQQATCHYCGGPRQTNSTCVNNHFVCDDCHQQDALSAIRILCAESEETDMIALLKKIRRHPSIPMHGPEHHAMVPGIILAAYRNGGGRIDKETVLAGIERGGKVPGGVCGFWGNCGAAAGVGIAFSILLGATPLTPQPRKQVQQITARVLARIAGAGGARCCQRETVTALREAARIARDILPVDLPATDDFFCEQFSNNKECLRAQCPLWREENSKSRIP